MGVDDAVGVGVGVDDAVGVGVAVGGTGVEVGVGLTSIGLGLYIPEGKISSIGTRLGGSLMQSSA